MGNAGRGGNGDDREAPPPGEGPPASGREEPREEVSPIGQPIYRYGDSPPREFKIAAAPRETVEEFEAHLARVFGEPETVLHEILSELIHLTGDSDQEAIYWPVRWLKFLARFPHEYATWLGMGHTLPNGDPPAPFSPDTRLCAWWLLPPLDASEQDRVATLSDGRTVHLYILHALYLEELSLKLNRGTNALLDAFSRANVYEVLDLGRRSAVRKKLFGLF